MAAREAAARHQGRRQDGHQAQNSEEVVWEVRRQGWLGLVSTGFLSKRLLGGFSLLDPVLGAECSRVNNTDKISTFIEFIFLVS